MKLKNELLEMEQRFATIDKRVLIPVIKNIIRKKEFRNLETRIVWICLWDTYTSDEIQCINKKYNSNDSHVETIAKKAFKALNINLESYM